MQQVMYMDVDDRVFVPPSDVYMVRSTFFVTSGVVTCLYVCRFVTPENLNTRLDECRFMTPEDLNMRLNVCCFMTPEDLNMRLDVCLFMTPEDFKHGQRGSCNNLWRLYTGERRRARPRRQSTNGCRRLLPTRAAYISSRTDQLQASLGIFFGRMAQP
ncbi:hypothetical protein Taro_043379 [Colocasia esculenta]|uniref:Uncharacterized protein n=1 Tax=Colocasia esculenta TaxID=4460 RepID=A0A843X0K5_COLES|nr:hypothetical protein [Colocasia esculenta]